MCEMSWPQAYNVRLLSYLVESVVSGQVSGCMSVSGKRKLSRCVLLL